MREAPKIVSLASALAALAGPVATPPVAAAASPDEAQVSGKTKEGTTTETDAGLPIEAELMSFIVHQASDGTMFPQHGSHVSHSSHASHSSHVSGYGGGGGVYVPSAPNAPYAPAPVVAPTPTSTTAATPLPVAGVDIIRVACTRASNGYGVNQIVGELVQTYGVPAGTATNIADQALVAVLTGGHFCDGHLG